MCWWSTTPGSFRPASRATKTAAAGWNCCCTTCRRPEANGAVPQAARARATHRGRLRPGQVLHFGPALTAANPGPARTGGGGGALLRARRRGGGRGAGRGEVPLPPYIHRPAAASGPGDLPDGFAAPAGAVACPTAGLHFTEAVLQDLGRRGIETVRLTLHVGPGTFMPVRHAGLYPAPDAAGIFRAVRGRGGPPQRRPGGGETPGGGGHHQRPGPGALRLAPGFPGAQGWCDLFIYPGYQFKAVDRLLTNFHLPKSTLLLLVSAFAGRDLILRAYAEAVKEKYRFYSYGDCMLIL